MFMKYIGITGHRGSGKTSVGYLMGNTINAILKGHNQDEIKELFNTWCDDIKRTKNAIYDCTLDYVYFDSFGEMPKAFVAQLLSIDMSILDSEIMRDNMYVNMRDFRLYNYDPSFKVITPEDILNNTAKRWKDCYITLRDFTNCLSLTIMQRFFGADVWLKSLIVNDEKWCYANDNVWTIFLDVKTKEELKYIHDKNGIVIKTVRPSHKKSNSGIVDADSEDAHFIINTEGQLVELFDSIYDVAEKICKI